MAAHNYSVFKAIADPTRRAIIHLLADTGAALTINDISDRFPSTRQAVTKHIKILKKAGLVEIEKRGREKYCTADPSPLREVYDWVSAYERIWDQKLSSLEQYLNQKSQEKDTGETK